MRRNQTARSKTLSGRRLGVSPTVPARSECPGLLPLGSAAGDIREAASELIGSRLLHRRCMWRLRRSGRTGSPHFWQRVKSVRLASPVLGWRDRLRFFFGCHAQLIFGPLERRLYMGLLCLGSRPSSNHAEVAPLSFRLSDHSLIRAPDTPRPSERTRAQSNDRPIGRPALTAPQQGRDAAMPAPQDPSVKGSPGWPELRRLPFAGELSKLLRRSGKPALASINREPSLPFPTREQKPVYNNCAIMSTIFRGWDHVLITRRINLTTVLT